jgi:hypothetical protein
MSCLVPGLSFFKKYVTVFDRRFQMATKAERKAKIKAQNEAHRGGHGMKDRATKEEVWTGDLEQVAKLFNREATFWGRV